MYWLHWKYYKRDYNLWLDWVILWYGVPLPNQDGFRSSKLLFYTSTVFVVIVVLINTTITTSDAAIKEMPTIRNSNQYWIVGEKKYEIPKWLTLCKEALDGWAWWGPGYRWLAGRQAYLVSGVASTATTHNCWVLCDMVQWYCISSTSSMDPSIDRSIERAVLVFLVMIVNRFV